jgi:uncharacterized protein (DUF2345 family)
MSISSLNLVNQTTLVPQSLLGYSSNGQSALEINPTSITIAGDLNTATPIYVGISAATGLTTTLATGLDVNCDFNMNGNDITNLDTLSSTIGTAMNITGDDNLTLTAGGDLSLTGDASVYITATNTSIVMDSPQTDITGGIVNITATSTAVNMSGQSIGIGSSSGDITLTSNNNSIILDASTDLNMTAGNVITLNGSADINITSTDNINLTSSANAINLNANLDITLTAVQGFLNITSSNDEISLTSSGATKITSNTGNIELIPINDGVTENGIVRINKNNSLLGDGFLTAGTIDISSDELGYNISPQLTITNLNATAGITSGVPSVSFYKNGRIAGNNDRIGDFYFNANDTTNNKREWARMEVVTRNVTGGNEDGSISFFASLNGVSTEFLRINGADGDNNFLRPLDMNGSSIFSTSGSLSISASSSTGAGTITLTPKPLGNLIFANLPTSAVGLPTGAVWNNLGVLNIAP